MAVEQYPVLVERREPLNFFLPNQLSPYWKASETETLIFFSVLQFELPVPTGTGLFKLDGKKFQASIFEQDRKDKTTHKIRDNMPKTLLNSFINLMPSTPQKRLYGTTNIINKAS
jgi:hypothetical protein